jgi:hypothetical protein
VNRARAEELAHTLELAQRGPAARRLARRYGNAADVRRRARNRLRARLRAGGWPWPALPRWLHECAACGWEHFSGRGGDHYWGGRRGALSIGERIAS